MLKRKHIVCLLVVTDCFPNNQGDFISIMNKTISTLLIKELQSYLLILNTNYFSECYY